ncbi:hypothetical protein [Propionivibrio dicarboxylicus]|uniref:Uncharacterized protein n=1 Tax=Propionivibrio dicarboxylicus TaxID=83767 RepID=A0A1G8ANQ5_9RHOO|nr:hypothetical protein [Propionivibrio dicarboxylicus]SDH22625.1 hypothetical protein SAMN05660652_01449 [Propionivibrio dicarboxylicus]
MSVYSQESAFKPRILSDEEIEIIISGDRKAIDKHILFSLNRLADAHDSTLSTLKEHQGREDKMMEEVDRIGGVEAITKRAMYVDSQIERRNARTLMMTKVSQSSITWALLAFFAFVASAVWQDFIHAIKTALRSGV